MAIPKGDSREILSSSPCNPASQVPTIETVYAFSSSISIVTSLQ
jgi:hypothetical protein